MSRANPRFRRINPPLPAVGSTNGVCLYRIWGTIENQMTITGMHLLSAVPAPTQTQLGTLLSDCVANVFHFFASCVSTDWVCTNETLDVVHRNDILGVSNVTHVGTIGGRTGGHLPTEIAAVIIKKTSFKGQHGRGRVSLPAISPTDVTNSTITAAGLITALANYGVALTTGRTDGTNSWQPAVAQRSNTSPKLVIAAAGIFNTHTNLVLGTVRRRKLGRGK